MVPFVPTRGVTSSCMPQLKNASLANMNLSSPGISAIFMSRSSESELLFEVRFAATVTFGYLVVMSTVAFLPLATMIRGLENIRESFSRSRALSTRYISEKSNVPLKWEIVPSSPPMYPLSPEVVPPVSLYDVVPEESAVVRVYSCTPFPTSWKLTPPPKEAEPFMPSSMDQSMPSLCRAVEESSTNLASM